jgi:lipid-A-disaccharide synthase
MAVPMVIVYRISAVSYWVARKVVDVTSIGLVNHIAGKQIVPELIQENLTPRNLAREGLSLLQGGERRENMIKNLEEVRALLGQGGASERTAEIAMQMLSQKMHHSRV